MLPITCFDEQDYRKPIRSFTPAGVPLSPLKIISKLSPDTDSRENVYPHLGIRPLVGGAGIPNSELSGKRATWFSCCTT